MTTFSRLTLGQRIALYKRLAPLAHYDSHQLAVLCGVCPRQLERHFERDLGQTPQKWLHTQRMLAAAYRMLERESITIKEVACELGITEPANFTREFKGRFGMSPSEFLTQKTFFQNVAR